MYYIELGFKLALTFKGIRLIIVENALMFGSLNTLDLSPEE